MASGTGQEHSWGRSEKKDQPRDLMDRLRDPTARVKLFASRSTSDVLTGHASSSFVMMASNERGIL